MKTLDGVLSDSLARPRLSSLLLAFFASLSVGLASLGVYGVLAFAARQRVREVGIRMALGAHRSQVLNLFLREGAILVGVGVGIERSPPYSRAIAECNPLPSYGRRPAIGRAVAGDFSSYWNWRHAGSRTAGQQSRPSSSVALE